MWKTAQNLPLRYLVAFASCSARTMSYLSAAGREIIEVGIIGEVINYEEQPMRDNYDRVSLEMWFSYLPQKRVRRIRYRSDRS